MESGEWVFVTRPTEKDLWNPTSTELEDSRPLKVTFSGPAKYWTDGIPIGNGRLGAMVWGGVSSELIQLNEDTLWTGTPTDFTDPAIPQALSEVRNLVDSGRFSEATKAAERMFGKYTNVYQLLGDIKLEFDGSTYAEGTYYRELDLDTATGRVKYSVDDVEFTREHFVSYPDQVIVTKISGSKAQSVSFAVSLDSILEHQCYLTDENQLVMEGICSEKRMASEVKANDDPKGMKFTAVLDLQINNGARLVRLPDDNKLKVVGADWAVLLLVASSSFEGPFVDPSDSKKNPTSDSLQAMNSIKKLSYSQLYSRHVDDFQNLFYRVSLQLEKSSAIGDGVSEIKNPMPSVNEDFKGNKNVVVPTVERIKSFESDEDPSLVELLFQFGRYLLISCSRPGTQVANLQGIWNKDLHPAWEYTALSSLLNFIWTTAYPYIPFFSSAPTLNINLEMNYWSSLPCNLRECQEPLFDFIKSLSINGSKVAQVNYVTSGWVAHHRSDIWAKPSADMGNPKWAIWPMAGAWVCTHLWEHYTYTLDKDFLINTAYPLLEGCASFLMDWLIEGNDGYLETNPSTSPEHVFIAPDGNSASVSYSSTMDMAIINEVFSAIVSASEVLGRSEDALVQNVLKAQPRLYPPKIAPDGSIMEWALNFKDPEVQHRHISHLFGLFPGHSITLKKNPELCKAAENTLYKRGENGPGWSTVWKTAVWARLQNSEHAYKMVKHLIRLVDPVDQKIGFEGGLYSNLFAAHPPFQIDANLGFPAALSEMLVQSSMTDLYLLPALPRDKWAKGCVKGLQARGGNTVNICWDKGDLQEVGLWSEEDGSCSLRRLHYRGTTVATSLSSGMIYTFNSQLRCIKSFSLSEVPFPRV
ncbi:hypothetical protein SADUNF_Sadunf16G0180600 [Salix dunnii]|uniref:Glycosyl hydrolase family 95 N-terminal domain-containing protein n=1 Tax=Salix dunnii TaxID=1413687 RepID=A0A835J7F2_9ROSI|nr:hypothetical protein SADUNF_Sadunf16G0180600 [Salix dunnii]